MASFQAFSQSLALQVLHVGEASDKGTIFKHRCMPLSLTSPQKTQMQRIALSFRVKAAKGFGGGGRIAAQSQLLVTTPSALSCCSCNATIMAPSANSSSSAAAAWLNAATLADPGVRRLRFFKLRAAGWLAGRRSLRRGGLGGGSARRGM